MVKIKGTNYDVLSSDGTVIDSNLKYVQIYDTFYAGVDKNNRVMLYTFEGYSLLKDSVALGSSTYCRTENPAFKVSSTTDGKARTFVISVFDGTEYKDVVAKEKTAEPVEGESNKEKEEPSENIGKPEDKEKTGE